MSTRFLYAPLTAGQTDMAIPSEYIDADFIKVYRRAHTTSEGSFSGTQLVVDVDYSFLNEGTIRLTTPADGATDYLIARETQVEPLVVQAPGVFSSSRVNLANRQALHLAEEARDLQEGVSDLTLRNDLFATALADLATANNGTPRVNLVYGLRSGLFDWTPGDQTANVAKDPYKCIYVAPPWAPSGAQGCWTRVWNKRTLDLCWGGAEPGNPSIDTGAIFNGSRFLANDIRLPRGTYWTNTQLIIDRTGLRLKGAGEQYVSDDSDCTRLLTTSATLTPIIRIGGPSLPPGGRDAMVRGCGLRDIYVGRTTGPDKGIKPTGVLLSFCIRPIVRRVKSVDSTYCFRIYGAVAPKIKDCDANCVADPTGTGTVVWSGYHVDSTAYEIGLAGGNGSVYVTECMAGCNNPVIRAGTAAAYRAVGKFQDTYFIDVEASEPAIGIALDGGLGGDADVHIINPILDQCAKWGIYPANLTGASTVSISTPYIGMAPGGQFGIYALNCKGNIVVVGGEILSQGTTQPVAIVDSEGVAILATALKDHGGVGVGISGSCRGLVIKTQHHNPTVNGLEAIKIEGSEIEASIFEPTVRGKVDAFTYGIRIVGNISNRNKFEMTGVDSDCILGGSPNKLVKNSIPVTTTGINGSDFVSGAMT